VLRRQERQRSRVGSVAARSFGNLGEAPPLQVEKVWKFRPKFRQMISSVVRIAADAAFNTSNECCALRERSMLADAWPEANRIRQRVRVGAVCVFCKGEIT
jgi:hypothetical protein